MPPPRGRNWHQVVDSQVRPLGDGLALGETSGFRHLLLGANVDNQAPIAICFDDSVVITAEGRLATLSRYPDAEPVGSIHIPLPPGQTVGWDVDRDFDCASLVYTVARWGRQDLHVLCYR